MWSQRVFFRNDGNSFGTQFPQSFSPIILVIDLLVQLNGKIIEKSFIIMLKNIWNIARKVCILSSIQS
uniref:Uncharacterized protein n=1 Tax=Cannabis sativa TaxID=3483 RepID=A0A803R4Q1_CANSA